MIPTNHTYHFHPKHFYWLMTLLVVLLLGRLGAAPIYILDEVKNAQCAREMLESGNWIVPTFNGELRTDKPPLHYFFIMLSYKMFGVNAFAARLFSAIFGLLTVLITFRFTKRHSNAQTAFFTALTLVVSAQFLFEFRLSVPDPYLIFFIALASFSAFTYLQENQFGYLLLAAAAFGLAILAKGPVAIALPGLCLLLWVIWKKKWKLIFTWKLLVAAALMFAIALPWYIAVHQATDGAWTQGFFIDHNINRFSDPQEGHGGFFLLTIIFMVVGLLPFTAFMGEMAKQRKALFSNDLVQFSGIVVVCFAVFFSMASTKLPNYPMPCYPFAAIILGQYINLMVSDNKPLKQYPFFILLFLLIAIPIAGYVAIGQEAETASVAWVALLLLIVPVAMLILLFLKRSWPTYKTVFGILAVYSIFNVTGLQLVYPILYAQNPVNKTIKKVKQYPDVFAYQIFNSAYRFQLDKNIKKTYHLDSLKKWVEASPNCIVISRIEYLDSLKTLPLKEIDRRHDIFELPTTLLMIKNDQP
jgi:4-amino-4-deoxy-L-arabinose transferase-like glycosyltransferase